MTAASSNPAAVRIGIIGGGPAGLTTALALEQYCDASAVSVSLFDKNKSFFDYPGVEYGIQARACRALDRLGIKERALRRGVRAHRIEFYNSRLERSFRPIKSDPDNTRCVVRQEFLTDLAGLIETTAVRMEQEVVSVSPADDAAVTLHLTHRDGRQSTESFDAIIACDGSFSTVRRQFFPDQAEKKDQGFSCIYMLLEAADPSTANDRFLNLANGGTSQIIMGHHSTLTLFPLGKNRLAYGIGFDHATKGHLWAEQGLDAEAEWKSIAPNTRRRIAQRLTDDACPHDSLYTEALEHVDDWASYKIYLWKMQDTDPLVSPTAPGLNAVLIGDAAHAILPTIGMGASLAIEDAEQLGRDVARLVDRASSPSAFRTDFRASVAHPYAKARVPVWVELVRRARLAAKENFVDQQFRKRFAIGPAIPNDALSRIVSAVETAVRRVGL